MAGVEGIRDSGDEWRALRAFAEARGLVRSFDASIWVGRPGGSEHVCRPVDDGARWEKITHSNRAGWRVDLDDFAMYPAWPLQYLRRLQLANHLFGDDIRFEALVVGPDPYDYRILTSQPHVLGDVPDEEQLVERLESDGFTFEREIKLGAYDSMCFRRGSLWLFDVRPVNFVLGEDGHLYGIDVIVQDGVDEDLDY